MPVKGEGERQPQSALGLLKQMDIHKKENTWCRNGRRCLCRALAAQRPQLCGARLGTPGEKFGTLNLAWLHGKRTSVLICSATSENKDFIRCRSLWTLQCFLLLMSQCPCWSQWHSHWDVTQKNKSLQPTGVGTCTAAMAQHTAFGHSGFWV